MPATSRTRATCALALAGLGLAASTLTALARRPRPTAAPAGHDDHGGHEDARRGRPRGAPHARRASARVLSARDIAMRQRGDAYAYGAAGPDRFDCSGLVCYSYRPRRLRRAAHVRAQAGYTRRIAKKDMRAGDLMFFHGSGGVYHAAIFLRWSKGHAVMLHSPGSGQRVRVAAPWTSQWFGGTLRRR